MASKGRPPEFALTADEVGLLANYLAYRKRLGGYLTSQEYSGAIAALSLVLGKPEGFNNSDIEIPDVYDRLCVLRNSISRG